MSERQKQRDALDAEGSELKRSRQDSDEQTRSQQAAHEQALKAANDGAWSEDAELQSETVVDLTSASKDDGRQVAPESRIPALELALREAEMRAESAELELDDCRRPARIVPSVAPVDPPPPEPSDGVAQFPGPARASTRITLKHDTEIQIDGTPGTLVDLSLIGAQLLAARAMKPNRLITVTIPVGDISLSCKAKVIWSRLEPRAGQLWYRAGVAFTSADRSRIQALLAMHKT